METMQMVKVEKLVPELRFKGFEGEFEYKKLGDVSNVIMGQSPDSKSYNENGEGYYLIQGNADIKNRISSPRQWTNMPTKTCEIGDVILTVRAPVGAVAKSLHNACIGRGVCVIRNLEKYDLEYIYQFLLDFETKWGKLEQGSTFTAVSGADIKSIKIVLPSLTEQQKIASFLSAVDEKIHQLNRKKELMEQYKKGVMQQLFSGELRFKDEDGKDYPKWEEKKLGDLGVFKGGGTPSTDKPEFWEGTIPWISSSDLTENDVLNIKINRFITDKAILESATKLIPEKSVLFVSRVGVGKIAVCSRSICTSQDFANFIPYEINSFYLAYYFLENNTLLVSYSQGTSIKGFTSGDLKSIKLRYPVLAEQQKIADFLSNIDTKIESTTQQITQTQTFKKGLLQKMFVAA